VSTALRVEYVIGVEYTPSPCISTSIELLVQIGVFNKPFIQIRPTDTCNNCREQQLQSLSPCSSWGLSSFLTPPRSSSSFVRKIIWIPGNSLHEGRGVEMTDNSDSERFGLNAFPGLLGGLNLLVSIGVGLGSQTFGVGFWDALFVLAGAYFVVKGIRYISQANDIRQTRVRTQELESFPKKGIYRKIRHPIGAAFIYINIALCLLFRSLALISVAAVFGALWFMLARYQDNILLGKFDERYSEYMAKAGMFRGKGNMNERLQDSGYGMY
jgi:protein-S-isoprenylcysteine O-methyltransferase Ste14